VGLVSFQMRGSMTSDVTLVYARNPLRSGFRIRSFSAAGKLF
jgi:hypothetical protein